MCLSNVYHLGYIVNLQASDVYCVKCGATNPGPDKHGIYHGHKYDKSKTGYEHDLFELVECVRCISCGKLVKFVAYACDGEVNTAEVLAEAQKEREHPSEAWIDDLEKLITRERVKVQK